MPGLGKSFGRYAVITTQYSQLPRYRYRWVNRKGKRKRAIVCEPVISAYPNSGEKKVAQPTRHRSSAERTGQFAGLVCAPSPRIVRGFNCALRRARRKKRASSRLEGSPFSWWQTREHASDQCPFVRRGIRIKGCRFVDRARGEGEKRFHGEEGGDRV